MAKAADRIDEDLGSGKWLAETDYGLADIAVFPHAAHFEGLGIAATGSVQRSIELVIARPSTRPLSQILASSRHRR